MLAIGHDVFQQAVGVNLRARISDIKRCPIGLIGNWAIGFEQMRVECFSSPHVLGWLKGEFCRGGSSQYLPGADQGSCPAALK